MKQGVRLSRRSHELRIQNGDVRLGGQLWLPANEPLAAVLMVPGSGPSDRHNDVFFPPIRGHLVANGIAAASFDKRGVGASTGDWLAAGIVEQADDVLAALETLRETQELADVPIGLFGHSQGGWVVLEAAARGPRMPSW
jgi:alpha-beta hydrolase superfamily lysophospholipase